MKKVRLAAATVLAVGVLFGGAPAANASTCVIADPDVEAIVCPVHNAVFGTVCKAIEKWTGCVR